MNSNKCEKDPRALIILAKEGNKEAFSDLYELYFVPVFRYIYHRVGSREEAEDLAQTVFLKVYNSIYRFEEKGKSPLAYFFTVARNTVIDHARKKKEITVDDLEQVSPGALNIEKDIHESIDREKNLTLIKEAMEDLTEEQREIVSLKFISGLSNMEIAEMIGKNEGAVRQLQCRALKALRGRLTISDQS